MSKLTNMFVLQKPNNFFEKEKYISEDAISNKKSRIKEILKTIDKFKKENKNVKELEPLFRELDYLYDLIDE